MDKDDKSNKSLPLIITGEILDNTVIFLIISEYNIGINVFINDEYSSTHNIKYLAIRLILPYSKLHNYIFTTVEGTIISQHNLSSSNNKLIFLSCDMPAADTKHSLINNFINDSGICFHLGDNIYGDKAYNSNNTNYKDIYLSTWRRWANIMCNFSHLMIADDHDVRDGFNILDVEYKNSSNKKLLDAITCYRLFQTSLQHNLIDGKIIKRVDDVTTVYCISRTITNITPIELIKRYSREFNNNVIIATSSAPIPMNSKIPYEMIFGSYGWKYVDLLELYDLLFALLESRKVNNVILIGGDLHFGVSGIIRKGNLKIHVYVTSAISAHPTFIENILASSMTGNFVFDKYSIELMSRADRNYLTIQLPINKDSPGTLTYSNYYWPKSITSYVEEMFYIVKPSINFNMLVDGIQQL